MGKRKALSQARKIYSDEKDGLSQAEKFAVTLRAGYVLRALDYGRIRCLNPQPGDYWSMDEIREYAEGLSRLIGSFKTKEARKKETLAKLKAYSGQLQQALA